MVSHERPNLSVDLAPHHQSPLRLANPIIIASGTFGYDGYGRGISPDMPLGNLGAVIPKTVTRYPREGNPEPRWYPSSYREGREAGECIYLNSIGLANPGIEAALETLAPQWAEWDATVFLSLSAESVAEFGEMAGMTPGVKGFQAVELNLSCPNIENGAFFSHDPSPPLPPWQRSGPTSICPSWPSSLPTFPTSFPLPRRWSPPEPTP